MQQEWLNRRVKIEDAPPTGFHFIGQTGRICPIGGYGYEPDDVCVKIDNDGPMEFFKIHQLTFIDDKEA